MLKRSSSDLKIRSIRHSGGDQLEGEGEEMVGSKGSSQARNKKELFTSLRRSFRRKPKQPVLQSCDDDFTMFTSHSASSTPLNARRGTISYTSTTSTTNTVDNTSSTGYGSNGGLSDSDTANSASHSPPSVRSGKGLASTSDGSGDKLEGKEGKEREGEEASTPEGGNMVSGGFLGINVGVGSFSFTSY